MLGRKLFRTMKLYKAQFISMIIMAALGVGMFVGFNMEWVSIEENMSSFFEDTGFADYRIVSETGFSEKELLAITEIEGVDAASRYLSVDADVVGTDGDSLALTVTTDPSVSGFLVMEGDEYDPESRDGIWLSDKYAAANDIGIGDEIELGYENLSVKGVVKGLIKAGEYLICVRGETQLMPDFTTYGFAYVSPAFYKRVMPLGITLYPMINVRSDLSTKEFFAAADEALGKTTVILTKNETISYAEAEGEASEGKAMGSVLPTLFLLIGVLTMITTMHRITVKEKIQIGTLKALGFRDSAVTRHYTSYAFLIAAIGSILGIAMGYPVCGLIMNPDGMMGTYLDMPVWKNRFPFFCGAVIAGLILLMTLIGYCSVREMLKGSAADSLRPYVPKKMKPMLIERTAFFHKLPFGTRWNLRDIVRQKTRTAMSLIGIIGCMILVVASLGMRDTMNGFLDLYYDKALNYSSKIVLTENAPAESVSVLSDRYEGDASASIAVQIDEKTISLDIYNVTHDKIRLIGEDGGILEKRDDGAYICVRIAEKFGLKAGDSFTISPFGTDDSYTLTVAGIMRSISECAAITAAYADQIGIPYTIDSIYTDEDKAAIEADEAISVIQSKMVIIDSFKTFTSIMDTMVYLLVIGALLLGIVVLYNLGIMSFSERSREMATLKVLGFRDKKIGRLLAGQNLSLSVVGVILGLPCGVLTLKFLLEKLAGEYEMVLIIGPMSYLISIVLVVGMAMIVSLMVSRKNKKIDMVEALKGAE